MRWRKVFSFALVGFAIAGALAAWADDAAVEERMRRDITFLASDECEGRGPGTKGLDKAAEYIAAEFAKSGLKPAGAAGSYFQPFSIYGPSQLDGSSKAILTGPMGQVIELNPGVDFEVVGMSGAQKVTAPVVFAGFGATAKEIGYDDYKDMDVAGKIVVLLRHTPRWGNKELPFDGARKDVHANPETKFALAESQRAAGIILVNDQNEAPGGDKLMSFKSLSGGQPSTVPIVHVRRNVVDAMLNAGLGKGLLDIEKAIDRDLKPRSALVPGWKVTLETAVKRTKTPVKNVIAVLEGAGPLADEIVVVGAHYDHLGYGGAGSRAKNQGKDIIHHGADDNASGTTSVIELARRFGAIKNRQGRRIVFMTFSAEERGLLGSRHYCNREPIFPLANTVAMVNLDMVGRLPEDADTKKGKLIVEGTGTAKEFDKLVETLNPGFLLTKKPGGLGPSDHDSFCRKDIPVIFLWNGVHKDYHLPSDTSDKINVPGMRQIADFAERLIANIAAGPQRPQYVKVANTFSMTPKKQGPRLGLMPNYEEGKEGVVVEGVTDNGPAAQAGLKVGDLIVEIAGKQVKNINNYMVVLSQQQSGQAIEITVIRGGKKLTLKAVPK